MQQHIQGQETATLLVQTAVAESVIEDAHKIAQQHVVRHAYALAMEVALALVMLDVVEYRIK